MNGPSSTHPPAGQAVSEDQIQQWVDTFHQQGYLFLQNVLPPDWCTELREDLDRVLEEDPTGLNASNERIQLAHRMFEHSPANLRLFDMEPIVSLAEALIAPTCHVIHNNSFRTPPGGGLSTWHQDDRPTTSSQTANRPPTSACPFSFLRPTTTSPTLRKSTTAAPKPSPVLTSSALHPQPTW